MDKFRKAVVESLSVALLMPPEQVDKLLAVPPDDSLGDFAFPCFSLSKELKKSPSAIASELQPKIRVSRLIGNVVSNGAYLNFFVDKSALASETIPRVLAEGKRYGSLMLKGKRALIEHTSINPNASPHVGRARNAIIGDSIARVLKFHGYKTDVHYFVNDIGKQVAMLVLGCRSVEDITFSGLLKAYVGINAEMEKNTEVENEVFALLKQLEGKDAKVVREFRHVVGLCIRGQKEILGQLGIDYDFFDYESDYLWSRRTAEVLEKLESTKRVFVDDDGRKVLNLEGFVPEMKAPVFVLTRADKTSLYGLRDLAYNLDKLAKAKGGRNIVVLGEDHKLYFRQVAASLSLLGLPAPEVIHYSFVLLSSGKMSTRSGNVVLLEDFMAEAYEKSRKELESRGEFRGGELEALARSIGFGALKYSIARISPEKNVTFDWEHALSFEGESAPYIQYSHARICSILNKAGSHRLQGIDYSALKSAEEFALVKLLARFPEVCERASSQLRPHFIATYLHSLADSFNTFYHACPVLAGQPDVRDARLALCMSVRQVLETGLNLLGIDAPERM